MRRRKRLLLVLGSVACLLAAAGLLAWHYWPEPPPTTAEEVYAALTETDPAELPEEELERWIARVASTVDRLPPHEVEKLVAKALADPALRERFQSLSPEQREKMASLVSEEQRARMMAKMAGSMVQFFRSMPAPLRKAAFQQMRARRDAAGRKHPPMTKERFAEWHSATTPRQRAEFVRAMREMREMLEEAGVKE